jgi:hypothetical protein
VTAGNKELKTSNGGFNCSSISVSLSSQVDKSMGTSLEGVTLHTESSDSLPNSDRRRKFKKNTGLFSEDSLVFRTFTPLLLILN